MQLAAAHKGFFLESARSVTTLADLTEQKPLLMAGVAAGAGFALGARWLGSRPLSLIYEVLRFVGTAPSRRS